MTFDPSLDRLSPTGLADEDEDLSELSPGARQEAERAMRQRDRAMGRGDDLMGMDDFEMESSDRVDEQRRQRRRRGRADDLIDAFGLDECMQSRFAQLSLGQQNRTNLARYLLQDFDLHVSVKADVGVFGGRCPHFGHLRVVSSLKNST